MWISVPQRGSDNGEKEQKEEEGGRGKRRAGVVGYNGGLSREMTADGNRDGGPSRYTARRSRDHSGDSTRLDPIAAASGLYALQIITAVLTFHSKAGKLVPEPRPLALEYGAREREPARRGNHISLKFSYACFSSASVAPAWRGATPRQRFVLAPRGSLNDNYTRTDKVCYSRTR